MSEPYYYLRSHPYDGDLWIVGGRDHKTGQEENTYDRYLQLEEYVRDRFDVQGIDFYWGAELFESVDVSNLNWILSDFIVNNSAGAEVPTPTLLFPESTNNVFVLTNRLFVIFNSPFFTITSPAFTIKTNKINVAIARLNFKNELR